LGRFGHSSTTFPSATIRVPQLHDDRILDREVLPRVALGRLECAPAGVLVVPEQGVVHDEADVILDDDAV